ncbi:MAG TPA: ROK family protein [Ilumatobacter sp.]|nr:ROK family protein [Ilumatobacter sp.]
MATQSDPSNNTTRPVELVALGSPNSTEVVAEEEVDPERPVGFLAVDLGASRLTAGIVDADGEIIVRDRVATPNRNVWPAVKQLIGRVLAANPGVIKPTMCGVTCPGPIDRSSGSMKPVGMPTWHDFPIRRELATMTGLPVEVETPARGLARAELWLGDSCAQPPRTLHFAALLLGDDVDGALVSGGKVLDGLTGNLGQFGHLIVEPDGERCVCGATGCLTQYAGVRGIEAGTGRDLRRTPPSIVERTGIMVGRACASIAAMTDVSHIVIGGPVPSVLGLPFFDALGVELEQRSRLSHLDRLNVRSVGVGKVGPLVSAAAVARSLIGGLSGPVPLTAPQ